MRPVRFWGAIPGLGRGAWRRRPLLQLRLWTEHEHPPRHHSRLPVPEQP